MQRQAGPKASELALEAFVASLRDLKVEVHLAKSEERATEAIRAVLSNAGKSIVVAGIPPRYEGMVRSALTGAASATFVEDLQGRARPEVLAALSSADVGITWAVNGLASEGALLEVVYDDSFKLASSLPIVHIALLESSSILPSLAEAMPLVGDIIAGAPANKKPIISFISGPSKTGDIEMRLLYGVHGPHTVHALIIDWR
jgi:L-lactate dehydrogenase complex protein LldG